jgi:acyl carrier protein
MEARIKQIMSQIFSVDPSTITAETSQASLGKWDSLGHMNLCAALEEEFGIAFDTDQVVGMTSYEAVLNAVSALSNR